MSTSYPPKTPGVFVQEVSTLPPSVVAVSTAIPAFIGPTKVAPSSKAPQRIETLMEYVQRFGGAPESIAGIEVRTDGTFQVSKMDSIPLLYYSMRLYFENGGGPCYIVSTGTGPEVTLDSVKVAITSLEAIDEVTLVLIPDAVRLEVGDYLDVCASALQHCAKMGDRFAILDVRQTETGDPVEDARNDVLSFRKLSSSSLSFGAAYTPYLRTTISLEFDPVKVPVTGTVPRVEARGSRGAKEVPAANSVTLESLRTSNTGLFNQIRSALANERAVLPPGGAMAGIYARVDGERGVWKAPANVAVGSVLDVDRTCTDEQQEGLNVDPVGGRSINVIRTFTGRGTLVWGARTLAGNDNEWRYVSVRRLFLMIEESAQQSTAFAVFEPNDATTWLKVKAMIESFLYGLWEQGALAGPKPEAAYFVHVGLGVTMTAQDILEGRMIVEIGIAAVRPAEFIILKFTHKLQQA